MDTRRSFLRKAGLLSGGTALWTTLPPTLQRALAINPDPGTTFYDAEHIVFLMQENRSFDHALGMLQGVRGFNDPRAIRQPNGLPVWLQKNARGETYAPFPFDMQGSNITWQGGLQHSWSDQVDARNMGRYDRWLHAKDPGGEHHGQPFTLGYFSRKDIPFYYALADCFTVCDHNFCSSLTGTTPNRLYFWSGTIREKLDAAAQANVWNHNADHGAGIVHWKTYPERLEENGVSWKVYQNEIYLDVGLGNKQSWLDNFGDNPLEYFSQYHTRLHPEYLRWLPEKIKRLESDLDNLRKRLTQATITTELKERLNGEIRSKEKRLAELKQEQTDFTPEKWEQLSAFHKNIHQKAFATNRNDPDYHELTQLKYSDNGTERIIDIPKGDILKNFRDDVNKGKLPMVSWLAAPEHFSDHPSSAWFGAWYVSEVMDILTSNPEVWKKTILVLTYDENDGYFDHLPPYGAPNPYQPGSGKVSAGIDTSLEFVRKQEQSEPESDSMRESNIGLGYRVPMIIASPWSRGGFVNSEVFDHTSSLQFLEHFLEKKTGKKIKEENITEWRRTVCGDLRSVFRPYNGEPVQQPEFLQREQVIQDIYNARFKSNPGKVPPLTPAEIRQAVETGRSTAVPLQEKGIRNACALPYQLEVNGTLNHTTGAFEMTFKAGKTNQQQNAGAPFYVYMNNLKQHEGQLHRDYAVKTGDTLQDQWLLEHFNHESYDLKAYGPNGFYRSFQGNKADPLLNIDCSNHIPAKGTGKLVIGLHNKSSRKLKVQLKDISYGTGKQELELLPGSMHEVLFDLEKSFGWYDVEVTVNGWSGFRQQFSGHLETGAVSKTDPLMGGIL